MFKVTSEDGQVPRQGENNISHADVAFNSATLSIVSSAIEAASGLKSSTMFHNERRRLGITIGWALEKLEGSFDEGDDDIVEKIRNVKKAFGRVKRVLDSE
jgi:hypothetical protein